MRFSASAVLLLLGSTSLNVQAECTAEYVRSIYEDNELTELQKEIAWDSACLGQTLEEQAKVMDVRKGQIKLNTGEMRYAFYLLGDHGCGDLVDIDKGDELRLIGEVSRVYPKQFNLANSRCLDLR